MRCDNCDHCERARTIGPDGLCHQCRVALDAIEREREETQVEERTASIRKPKV